MKGQHFPVYLTMHQMKAVRAALGNCLDATDANERRSIFGTLAQSRHAEQAAARVRESFACAVARMPEASPSKTKTKSEAE